jgi:hypothetical protein
LVSETIEEKTSEDFSDIDSMDIDEKFADIWR